MYFLGLNIEEGALDTFDKDSDCQPDGLVDGPEG